MTTKNETARVVIPERIYFRIGDVAKILGVKPYVIRFWEGEFPFVAPEKSTTGQRVYRRTQIEGLVLIKHLLHIERYSIEGARKRLTELRRQSKLKESMLQLVETGSVKPGDRISKDQIVAADVLGNVGSSLTDKAAGQSVVSDLTNSGAVDKTESA